MSNTDRATQIITDLYGDGVGAEALADEHLLVTDEIQAVLDAVLEWRMLPRAPARAVRLQGAFDAYVASWVRGGSA